MSDDLDILDREIERLLQSSIVEESTLNSDCLQVSAADSLDVAADSDNGAKYKLVKVYNTLIHSTRVLKIGYTTLSCLWYLCFFLKGEKVNIILNKCIESRPLTFFLYVVLVF